MWSRNLDINNIEPHYGGIEMKNLKEQFPNVTKKMSGEWITRFEKSKNETAVKRLFDYLEGKYLEEAKELDPLTEEIYVNVFEYSKNWKNFFQINLELTQYNSGWEAYEGYDKYPVAIEIQIKDWYKNNDDIRAQEKLEDFLKNLPEDLNRALI